MATFHNGFARTMKAHYFVTEGDLRVIRPLVFTRERDIRAFAYAEKVRLPVISENCPACFEEPKVGWLSFFSFLMPFLTYKNWGPFWQERHRVKQLLAAQEAVYPHLFNSLRAAMLPFMSKNTVGLEKRASKKAATADAVIAKDDDDDE